MLYLKVAAVIALIISLLVSPSASNPKGTRIFAGASSEGAQKEMRTTVVARTSSGISN